MTVLAATAASTLLVLWYRRKSIFWKCRWEMAPTVNIAGIALCLLLIPPSMDDIWSRPFHAVTGLWNIENLVGHTAYLVGITALTQNMLCRLNIKNKRRFLRQRIELPATLFVPLHSGTFVWSASDVDIPDLIGASASSPRVTIYWMVFCAGCFWILGHLVWALQIIRNDERSRQTANLYLIALTIDCCCVASLLIGAIVPAWPQELSWGLMCLATFGYCAAASVSWRKKIKPLDLRPFEMLN